MSSSGRKLRWFKVDPTVNRIVKFRPEDPPERGDVVLVDDEICEVTYAKVAYETPSEPNRWTLKRMWVKAT